MVERRPRPGSSRGPSSLFLGPRSLARIVRPILTVLAVPNPAQDLAFQILAAAYGVIALVAFVQLIRIQLRVPEYGYAPGPAPIPTPRFFIPTPCSTHVLKNARSPEAPAPRARPDAPVPPPSRAPPHPSWTTQKVFHLLNFVCAGARAGVFPFRRTIDDHVRPPILVDVLMDLPGLLFFTTYTLLVLFWAEIYHQARSLPTDALRPTFVVANVFTYLFQASLWTWAGLVAGDRETLRRVSSLFLSVVSFAAAIGFAVYGGRLFAMLRRFPVESKGRRKKLREVGTVTAVCTACFLARSGMVALSTFASADRLDVLSHPGRNAAYYAGCEIAPSALVLFILRKLPPRVRDGQDGGRGDGDGDGDGDASGDARSEGSGAGRSRGGYRRVPDDAP